MSRHSLRQNLKLKQLEFKQKNYKQIFPNSVTMLGLAFGVSSMNMAYWGQWEKAMLFILLAGVFDFLDGKVARLLGVSSKYGMQLDSLSDFISFGVAPGFLMYQWMLDPEMKIAVIENIAKKSEAVGIGWGVVLFLTMCCAMRLARFNIMSEEKTSDYWKNFFMGVPAPAGAGLATFPLMLDLATHGHYSFFRTPSMVSTCLIMSGILMASRIPTISFKNIHFSENVARVLSLLRVVVLALIAGLVCMPWKVLSVVCFLYIISLPVGVYYFCRQRRACQVLETRQGSRASGETNREEGDDVPEWDSSSELGGSPDVFGEESSEREAGGSRE